MASNLLTVLEHQQSDNSDVTDIAVKSQTIETHFGQVHVHIQGQFSDKKAVFLTVHDIGTNHSSMKRFVDSDFMSEIRLRSVFIHLDVCGQETDAQDFDEDKEFPSIQQLGEEVLLQVLDELHVQLVIGIGEGAGANVLTRFGLKHSERVLGLILVHLVSSGVRFLDSLKEKLMTFQNVRRNSREMNASEEFLQNFFQNKRESDSEQRKSLNQKNLQKYVEIYLKRKEIFSLKSLDLLLICGQKSNFCSGVEHVHSVADKSKTSLLKLDGVWDPLRECPEKVAQSLLLFVKGLGLLTSCQNSSLTPSDTSGSSSASKSTLGAIGRRRTLSMEEYDVPRLRRLSLTK